MGTWSTAIEGNDTYHDIQNDFFHLYDHDHSMDLQTIAEKIMASYKDAFADDQDEDHNNSWFSLAHSLWKCGALDNVILNKVESIILSGNDITRWKELDASDRDLKARQKVLSLFLVKLRTPVSKPRKRAAIKSGKTFEPFRKGDCVAFRQNEGSYTGFLCLDTKTGMKNDHYVLFIAIRYYAEELPAEHMFKTAQVLVKQFGNWKDEVELFWHFPISKRAFNKMIKDGAIQIVGNLPVSTGPFHSDTYGGFSISAIEKQLEFEKLNRIPGRKITLTEYLENPDSFR